MFFKRTKASGVTQEIRVRRCYGCGAILQDTDPDEVGYVPPAKFESGEDTLCERCYKLRHYSTYKKTPDFEKTLADVIDSFRESEECPALRSYRDMASVCRVHPEWKVQQDYDRDNYAARVETESYVFYIRFIVRQNDYNFYVFGYEASVKSLVEENKSDETERKDENEQN